MPIGIIPAQRSWGCSCHHCSSSIHFSLSCTRNTTSPPLAEGLLIAPHPPRLLDCRQVKRVLSTVTHAGLGMTRSGEEEVEKVSESSWGATKIANAMRAWLAGAAPTRGREPSDAKDNQDWKCWSPAPQSRARTSQAQTCSSRPHTTWTSIRFVLSFLHGVLLPAKEHLDLKIKYEEKKNSFLSTIYWVQKENAVDLPCFLAKMVSLLKWITWLRRALRLQRIPLSLPIPASLCNAASQYLSHPKFALSSCDRV